MLPDYLDKAAGVGSCQAGHDQGLVSIHTCLGQPTVWEFPVTSTDSYCALCLPGLTLPTYKWIKEGSLHFRAQLASETPC